MGPKPTFRYQVRGDILTHPSDVQAMYDNVPVADKKLQWIEGTKARFDGYLLAPSPAHARLARAVHILILPTLDPTRSFAFRLVGRPSGAGVIGQWPLLLSGASRQGCPPRGSGRRPAFRGGWPAGFSGGHYLGSRSPLAERPEEHAATWQAGNAFFS